MKKLWANQLLVYEPMIFDLDIFDVETCEKVKDVISWAEGIISLEQVMTYTNPKYDRTIYFLLSVPVGDEANYVMSF